MSQSRKEDGIVLRKIDQFSGNLLYCQQNHDGVRRDDFNIPITTVFCLVPFEHCQTTVALIRYLSSEQQPSVTILKPNYHFSQLKSILRQKIYLKSTSIFYI